MNGWGRVPDTLRCRVRVEDYFRGLMRERVSYAKILRLARVMELRGVEPADVYSALHRMHPDLVDHTNEVIDAMRARAARPKPRPTMTLDEYVRSSVGPGPGRDHLY